MYSHGDVTTTLGYKIAGIWSGQEGSFLLWATTTALFAFLAGRPGGKLERPVSATLATFLGCLFAILVLETPFDLLRDVTTPNGVVIPPRGDGMTPSLQNYWNVIHPPTIFSGFGSLAVPFAYAVGAMVTRDQDDWAKMARPWVLVGISILGLGLVMGGLWAYETQGWGGFWMWDPVENVSFVPWLLMAALVHGLIVQVGRGRWRSTNLLLAGLPFLAFCYGTFLTRSGLLSDVSVHSFANMDRHALAILKVVLGTLAVGFAALWIVRGRVASKPVEKGEGVDREGLYQQGALMLSLLAIGIAIGMSWPWFSAIRTGKGQAVEEPLYHQVVVWFFVPIMLLMAVTPFVSWRGLPTRQLFSRIGGTLLLSIGLAGFLTAFLTSPYTGFTVDRAATVAFPGGYRMPIIPWMYVLIFVCTFTAVANLGKAIETAKRSKLGAGAFLSHFGLAVLLGGLIVSRGFERKERMFVRAGEPATALGYQVALKGIRAKEAYDRDGKVAFELTDAQGRKSEVTPGLYYYPTQEEGDKAQVWPDIRHRLTHDFYFALFPPITDAFEKPLTLKPGTTTVKDGITIRYVAPVRAGQAGQEGTAFGAKLLVTYEGREYESIPGLELRGGTVIPSLVPAGPEFRAALLGLDAATRAATVQLIFEKPIYPVEIFTKPLTGLVWLGTGILTLGGFMSAASRRVRRKRDAAVPTPEGEAPPRPGDVQ